MAQPTRFIAPETSFPWRKTRHRTGRSRFSMLPGHRWRKSSRCMAEKRHQPFAVSASRTSVGENLYPSISMPFSISQSSAIWGFMRAEETSFAPRAFLKCFASSPRSFLEEGVGSFTKSTNSKFNPADGYTRNARGNWMLCGWPTHLSLPANRWLKFCTKNFREQNATTSGLPPHTLQSHPYQHPQILSNSVTSDPSHPNKVFLGSRGNGKKSAHFATFPWSYTFTAVPGETSHLFLPILKMEFSFAIRFRRTSCLVPARI